MNDNDIINLVLDLEGPPHNDPRDAGGETRWGMTGPQWNAIRQVIPLGVDFDKAEREDIAHADLLYYFGHVGLSRLTQTSVRLAAFDSAYLHGIDVLRRITGEPPAVISSTEDSYIPAIDVLNTLGPRSALNWIVKYRLERYTSYLEGNIFHPFAWGWLGRLHTITERCLKELPPIQA